MNRQEADEEFRSIIGHAFLGEEQNISKQSFDLAIKGCIDLLSKEISEKEQELPMRNDILDAQQQEIARLTQALADYHKSQKEDLEPGASNSDLASLASHSCTSGNSIQQEDEEPYWQGQMYIQGGELPKIEKLFEDNGLKLELTCGACPEQYDVFKQVGYLRLRHGEFRVDFPDCRGETIYEAEPQGDGIFENGERIRFMTEAMNAIMKKLDVAGSQTNSIDKK